MYIVEFYTVKIRSERRVIQRYLWEESCEESPAWEILSDNVYVYAVKMELMVGVLEVVHRKGRKR